MAVGGVKPVAQLAAIVADENREAAVEADEQQRQLAGLDAGSMPLALFSVERSFPSTLARAVRLSSSSSAARITACSSSWPSLSGAAV
jgi:hypothetical protein